MGRIKREDYVKAIETSLAEYVPEKALPQQKLFNAMRYSLLAGGKRIRPVLLLEFCGLCGGDQEAALPFACALEMVHTYSLIHDDLPCMDDDGMRRGRPSNHVVFGEAQALLAGDALLTVAFETMLSEESINNAGAEKAAAAAGTLAKAAGAYGMAGGQEIDLESEGQSISADMLLKMDECKTGALILAAAKMGCILAGADEKQTAAAVTFSKAVGISFQIVDDILDVSANEEALGKPVGSDAEKGKSTYVSTMGMEKAQEAVRELTGTAVSALDVFGKDGQYLKNFAGRLANRKN